MTSHLYPIYGTQAEWRAVYHLINYYKAHECPCVACKDHIDAKAMQAVARINQLIVAAAHDERKDD